METLHKDKVPRSGFAGVRENQMVMNINVFGRNNGVSWNGLGNFIYLSDANFVANGETGMHPHREVDIISLMVEGRTKHEGTLGNGEIIDEGQAQVQRAGGQGLLHNEINPDDTQNRMIQIWMMPEERGYKPDYKKYDIGQNKLRRIYGGNDESEEVFSNHTNVEIGEFTKGEKFSIQHQFIAYLTKGVAMVNGEEFKNGDLIRGDHIEFESVEDAQIVLIYEND